MRRTSRRLHVVLESDLFGLLRLPTLLQLSLDLVRLLPVLLPVQSLLLFELIELLLLPDLLFVLEFVQPLLELVDLLLPLALVYLLVL